MFATDVESTRYALGGVAFVFPEEADAPLGPPIRIG